MTEILELVGALCFGISAVPAAFEAFRAKTAQYSWGFLALWAVGEICMIGWAAGTGHYTQLVNYLPNFSCLAVVAYYNKGVQP